MSDPRVRRVEYAPCKDCGQPHPAWISCEAERQVLELPAVELPEGALPCGCEGPSATCADE